MKTVALTMGGLSLRVGPEAVHLAAQEPLRVLSSAPVGAELSQARHILVVRVPSGFSCEDVEEPLRRQAGELAIKEPYVGLLTALDLGKAVTVEKGDGRWRVLALATVGVSNPSAAGRSPVAVCAAGGTINIVVVADANLSPGALVNAALVATEAKALALFEAGVTTREGHPASGTSTDAVVLACRGEGEPVQYAGPVTPVGHLVGAAVHQAVAEGLRRYNQEGSR